VTPDEVGEIQDLTVATVLNGEVRRENVVSNMTFSPWFLVSVHPKVMTLLPPNCTNRQRPEGPFLRDGGRGAGDCGGDSVAVKRSCLLTEARRGRVPNNLVGTRAVGIYSYSATNTYVSRLRFIALLGEGFSEVDVALAQVPVSSPLRLRSRASG
jgi:hypothetical protein